MTRHNAVSEARFVVLLSKVGLVVCLSQLIPNGLLSSSRLRARGFSPHRQRNLRHIRSRLAHRPPLCPVGKVLLTNYRLDRTSICAEQGPPPQRLRAFASP